MESFESTEAPGAPDRTGVQPNQHDESSNTNMAETELTSLIILYNIYPTFPNFGYAFNQPLLAMQ